MPIKQFKEFCSEIRRIEKMLGSNFKYLTNVEQRNLSSIRRGICAAKALKALKALGKTPPPSPMPSEGGDTSVNEIPRFSVIASGGRAKEQTLGIRR